MAELKAPQRGFQAKRLFADAPLVSNDHASLTATAVFAARLQMVGFRGEAPKRPQNNRGRSWLK